ncbi:MAG: nuclease family protein, partial [Herminiimonas sp.]|nr:nuclease family protein [Herminiimonas sp.]
MLHSALLIPPSANFWPQVARALLDCEYLGAAQRGSSRDLSAIRVVVPTFAHARLLKVALAEQLGGTFIAPRINTLSGWLAMLPPDASSKQAGTDSERLMTLYAALREYAWLKKLFSARRNTDLLPLAQTLLNLSDELTQTLLPAVQQTPEAVEQRWHDALAHLSPSAGTLLSDEAQLVWSIWKSQLDGNDACVARFKRMLRLAAHAEDPLAWIAPIAPDAFEQAFLGAYGERQPVVPLILDWRATALEPVYASAWQELLERESGQPPAGMDGGPATPSGVSLYPAKTLEDEALCGARTVLAWLAEGKSNIAIVAQDRVVARRIRALLERAQLVVADETGWKLSTTRAAAAVAAWFEVVAGRAETVSLLDLLKSPFVFAGLAEKPGLVLAIELALRRANVSGGWEEAARALAGQATAWRTLAGIARQAGLFAGRKTPSEWLVLTDAAFAELDMRAALEADAAGMQVIATLAAIAEECGPMEQTFSFAEWRAFVSLQLEATPFVPPNSDQRVVMLPLNGARLRCFDAVLMVGADAQHLPSRPNEALFFANAVRRELGLATRESRQCQQMRDFAELISASRPIVLSWQAQRDGDPNPVSSWILRLQLALERNGATMLPEHRLPVILEQLLPALPTPPRPVAPHLLPRQLSASAYNVFVACPYQFFATRMLGLSGLDELTDMPEKRDYGDWLHQILAQYHEAVRAQDTAIEERAQLLLEISEKVFGAALAGN